VGQDRDPADHVRAAPEAPSDLLLRNPFIEKVQHPPFKRAHGQLRRI
jgi:hypothetical protein